LPNGKQLFHASSLPDIDMPLSTIVRRLLSADNRSENIWHFVIWARSPNDEPIWPMRADGIVKLTGHSCVFSGNEHHDAIMPPLWHTSPAQTLNAMARDARL
jgi:hypothetical protein